MKYLVTLLVLVFFQCDPYPHYDEVMVANKVLLVEENRMDELKGIDPELSYQVQMRFFEGKFNTENYYSYYGYFRFLAQEHGVDLSYLDNHPVVIEDRSHVNKTFVAWAKERDNDELVHIGINRDLFFNDNRSNNSRIFIMIHEFGHDVLNLPHIGTTEDCGDLTSIMNPCGNRNVYPSDIVRLTTQMFLEEYPNSK